MSSPLPDSRSHEERWRQRLKDAELRLTFARQYLKDIQRDYPQLDIRGADGLFAFRHALQAENLALAEYRRVLKIFCDLVVHGKIPDESASPKCSSSAGGGNP